MSVQQRVLSALILWRVPAFPQDAEGLGKQCACFLQQGSDISGIRDRVIYRRSVYSLESRFAK